MSISYVLEIGGNNIDISVDRKDAHEASSVKRLSEYYVQFLKSRILTGGESNKEKLLSRIASSLSDEGVVDMMMKLKDAKGQEEVINSVKELLEAYEDEPLDDFSEMEINGNRFSYLKTLDIDSIMDKLVAVGNEVKGKKWRVELDEEGKVVLCE